MDRGAWQATGGTSGGKKKKVKHNLETKQQPQNKFISSFSCVLNSVNLYIQQTPVSLFWNEEILVKKKS